MGFYGFGGRQKAEEALSRPGRGVAGWNKLYIYIA